MIYILVYIFLKKYGRLSREAKKLVIHKLLSTWLYLLFAGFIILLLLAPFVSKGQHILTNYKIVHDGNNIGWLRLEKQVTGNRTNLLLVSEINTRLIIRVDVSTKETALFENGRLQYASQYRKTNGKVKLDKQTALVNGRYVVISDGEKRYPDLPVIVSNLLSLYFYEPSAPAMLYCDKHECFVKIVKTSDGGYKVVFPDGNSNTYYYSSGICTKIRISNSLYTADIIINV